MRGTRDELVHLAQRVASMLSTVRAPGQHQADLREIHAQLVALAGAPSREDELLALLREARASFGTTKDAGELYDLLDRIDRALN